jgi:hypothetical protein
MGAVRLAVIALLFACTPPAQKQEREANAARGAIAAESAKAAVAASEPSSGTWDEPHLVERLVRSGLAPQSLPSEKGERYWGVPTLAYRVGSATLYAHLYPDSAARIRVTGGLDTLTLAPRGATSPYPEPRMLVVQNNLAAVLVGGSDRQRERVSLALTAGLPVSNAR